MIKDFFVKSALLKFLKHPGQQPTTACCRCGNKFHLNGKDGRHCIHHCIRGPGIISHTSRGSGFSHVSVSHRASYFIITVYEHHVSGASVWTVSVDGHLGLLTPQTRKWCSANPEVMLRKPGSNAGLDQPPDPRLALRARPWGPAAGPSVCERFGARGASGTDCLRKPRYRCMSILCKTSVNAANLFVTYQHLFYLRFVCVIAVLINLWISWYGTWVCLFVFVTYSYPPRKVCQMLWRTLKKHNFCILQFFNHSYNACAISLRHLLREFKHKKVRGKKGYFWRLLDQLKCYVAVIANWDFGTVSWGPVYELYVCACIF